jgi:tetratricopeptide (TPR) repeat protein
MKLILISLLIVLTVGAFVTQRAVAGVVYLAAPGQFPEQSAPPLLIRELARQALLLAARDGLGLYTRDQVLREWEPGKDGGLPLDAVVNVPALLMEVHWDVKKSRLRTQLSSIGRARAKVDRNIIVIDKDAQQWPSVTDALVKCEALSRGKDIDFLRTIGFEGEAQSAGNAEAPKDADSLLCQTTLMAPYSALQQVHAAIRESGESPARLGELVRGYANLGELTRFQWCSTRYVMIARSLLYAQRMVQNDPKSPIALYHRAYAFTFAGLHAAALNDLEQAAALEKQLQAAGKPVPPVPDWAHLIEPTCKYDLGALLEFTRGNNRLAPLAALMSFMNTRNCGSVSCLMKAGTIALKTNPACFEILDDMMAQAGVSSAHQLTQLPQQEMLATLPTELKLLPTIPDETQKALAAHLTGVDDTARLASVAYSLVNTSDPAEPSFALAGRILQETNFVHVVRRAGFLADMLGVDCSEYLKERAPLIADHPLRKFAEAYAVRSTGRLAALGSIEVNDPQYQMYELLAATAKLPKQQGKMTHETAWARMFTNSESTASDNEMFLYLYNPQRDGQAKDYASHILLLSPWSAPAIATLIRMDWKTASPHAGEWANRYHYDPAVISALAMHYVNEKKPDLAEPLLIQLVSVAPDRENFEALAGIYLARGDEDRWISTLQRVLDQPDYRLDHSLVESEIAWHLMKTGQYDRARPYADASLADSGSQWAMDCDARASEYQGDFTTTEQIVREETQRYGGPEWFNWCKRSGHGDVAAATRAADQWIQTQEQRDDHTRDVQIGNILYLENHLEAARKYYDAVMHDSHDGWSAMQLADVCAQLNDPKGRLAALQYAVDHCATDKNGAGFQILVDYAKLMLPAGDKLVDRNAVNQLTNRPGIADSEIANIMYFRSRELIAHGDPATAKSDFEQLVKLQVTGLYCCMLACDYLHKAGEATSLPKVPIAHQVK